MEDPLSWHVQNCDMIGSLKSKSRETFIFTKFPLWGHIPFAIWAPGGSYDARGISSIEKIQPPPCVCGLVTPYGVRDLDQHWFRLWLLVWWNQAIIWTNVDLPSMRSSGIHSVCLTVQDISTQVFEIYTFETIESSMKLSRIINEIFKNHLWNSQESPLRFSSSINEILNNASGKIFIDSL